jgi:hypoxanthine phosphoribosyltransferase
MWDYQDFLSEVLISESDLKSRVHEMGEEISRDYEKKNLLLVCILRGGVIFLTDLMRAITIPHAIEFMAVSSYGFGGRESTGQIRITLDLNTDISEWDVLLVEDIIDSGHTLHSVLDLLSVRKPRSLGVCALMDKTERREVDIPLSYCGFQIPNKFVFGYGLDIDDFYRNLPFVGVVDLGKYQKLQKGK